jgi:PAS domain S-box-containing protein
MAESGLQEYRATVSARLGKLSPLLQRYALGDFSETIHIPAKEDEFTELLVGLNLMVQDIREMIQEKEDTIARLEQAEKAVRESELRYRTLFQNVPVGIGISGPKGQVLAHNDTMCQMTGYSGEELEQIRLGDTYRHPEERALLLERLQRDGFVRHYEVELEHKDGTPYFASLSITPLALGGEDLFFTVAEDITDRKQAEQALRQYSERLEEMVEERSQELREREQWLATTLRSIGDAVIVTDAQEVVTLMNPVAETLTGWDEAEAVGKPLEEVFDIVNEQTGDRVESPVGKVLREGVVVGLANHTLLIARDGSTRRPIADSGAPLLDEAGKIIGTVMVFRDITARRQAERALRDSEQLLQATLYSLRDALFVLDTQARVVDVNPAASRIFGYGRDEILSRTTAFLHVDDSALDEFRTHLYPAVEEKGFLSDFEFRMRRKDGTIFPSEHSIVPLADEQGQRTGWVSVVRDITQRKQAEAALHRRMAELSALSGMANIVNESVDVDEILNRAMDETLRLVGVAAAAVMLVDREAGELVMAAHRGVGEEFVRAFSRMKLEEGMSGQAVQTGQAVILKRLEDYPEARKIYVEQERIQSAAVVPLLGSAGVIGTMNLGTDSPYYFDESGVELLMTVGRQIAIGVEKARLYEETHAWATELERRVAERTADIALVNTLNAAANRGESLHEILTLLARETGRIFHSNGTTVYLLSEDGERLIMQNLTLPPTIVERIEALIGRDLPPVAIPLQPGSLYREMLQSGKPRAIHDPETVQRLIAEFAPLLGLHGRARRALHKLISQIYRLIGVRSVLNIPLISEGETIGLLDISRREPFSEADQVRLVTLAGQLTTVLRRKRAEEALRESEQRQRLALQVGQIGAWEVDLGSGRGIWTPEVAEIWGIPQDFTGDFAAFCWEHVHPEDLTKTQERFAQIVQSGNESEMEFRIIRPDGMVRWIRWRGQAIRDNAANDSRVVGVNMDITERKQAEEALQEYAERLEEMVKERTAELQTAQERLIRQEKLAVLGQLAGGVGHELRNPLGAIKNAAYYLNMVLEDPDPETQEILEVLEVETGTAEKIIASLLDYARARPPTRRKVDLNDVVRETLSRNPLPDAPPIELALELDESLPSVLADPDQLTQVLGNLVRNAIQAMSDGGCLTVRTAVESPEWLALSVVDTGAGISEENLNKIFEPLFTTKAKGIGLGLALVKMIAEGHGGTIGVESRIGEGSTFTVRLPLDAKESSR